MSDDRTFQPIAIVGMACRLPQADGIDEYWKLLLDGRDAITPFPADRMDRELFFDSRRGIRGKTYSQVGGFVPVRPLRRDLLGLAESEIQQWDECHLIFAEVAARASLDAGSAFQRIRGLRKGVYVGHSGGSSRAGDLIYGTLAEQIASLIDDLKELNAQSPELRERIKSRLIQRMRLNKPSRLAGGAPHVEASAIARLTAKILQATGPQMAIDAACASSLVALDLACLAIQNGEIDGAIVGGASYNKCDSMVLFSQAQSCSSTGSRPFDEHADGLVSSEGYVAIAIKSLDQALIDGDRIWGVIRGLGLSSDGRGKSLWAPRREGQFAAMQRAYSGAIRPEQIQYIEAHATSTQVGDATEMKALADMFGQGSKKTIPIGSVKSNIGHTLETAGLASLLKGVLSMHHGIIPPTIHLQAPNHSIPWNELPFFVPTRPIPWDVNASGNRLGAVNAFGIGGLNVHVILESADTYRVSKENAATASPEALDPIAIIGRGMIVPGASSLDEFCKLLASEQTYITEPPEVRWPKRIGIRPSLGGYLPANVPSARGGYLADYSYDWRLHRVPPKQVERANPLQFMLLDAASQALSEAKLGKQEQINNRITVVVGTIFGSEFGHQLQIGLRIEELRRDLRLALLESGFNMDHAELVSDSFEQRFFEINPALLDETGSFTSSTLASRISKTFNLMGGALAIDAGECSASAALQSACNLLRSCNSDIVLCAAGQRAMDLPSLEKLASRGRISNNETSMVPGEGVVVFALQRLSEAKRLGNHVYGIVDRCEPLDLSGLPKQADDRQSTENTQLENPKVVTKLIHQVGDLMGARAHLHILASIESQKTALLNPSSPPPNQIKLIDLSDVGLCYQLQVRTSENAPLMIAPKSDVPKSISPESITPEAFITKSDTRLSSVETSITRPTRAVDSFAMENHIAKDLDGSGDSTAQTRGAQVFYFEAESAQDLMSIADRWVGTIQQGHAIARENLQPNWTRTSSIRCAVVFETREQLVKRLTLVAKASTDSFVHLSQEGVFVSAANQRRQQNIAIAFPGQGSQKNGFLKAWSLAVPNGDSTRQRIDASLMQLCGKDSEQLASDCSLTDRGSIWPVQASMVACNAMVASSIAATGIRPRFVFGHSLGELSAIEFAGAWNLESCLEFTFQRARAVRESLSRPGSLLSIHSSLANVQSFLRNLVAPIVVTHVNGPNQVVVGGPTSEMEAFQSILDKAGINHTLLSVPAPFHTPMLAEAQCLLAKATRETPLSLPSIPILSSVSNRFVVEPDEIRRNLLDQLVTPVRYTDLLERVADYGIDVILEMGPGSVLTKLHRNCLGNSVGCLWSADRCASPEVALVELEAIRQIFSTKVPTEAKFDHAVVWKSDPISVPPTIVFDATAARRKKKREAAQGSRDLSPVKETPASIGLVSNTPKNVSAMEASRVLEVPPADASRGIGTSKETSAKASSGDASSSETMGGSRALEVFLKDFIVEHTGYPSEMIELDWDLEADLGIDSIKQAQLFGELREMFDFEPRQLMAENVRTLRQLMHFLSKTGGKREWIESISGASTPSLVAPNPSYPPAGQAPSLAPEILETPASLELRSGDSQPSVATTSASRDELSHFMIDFVIEHTGYPADLVELNSEFEADLGLDSIKIAQLFGELRSHFSIVLDTELRKRLSGCLTIGDLLDVLAPRSVQDIASELSPSTIDSSPMPATTPQTRVSSLPSADHLSQAVHVHPEHTEVAVTASETMNLNDGVTFEDGLAFGRKHRQALQSKIQAYQQTAMWTGLDAHIKVQSMVSSYDLPYWNGIAEGSMIHPLNLAGWMSRDPSMMGWLNTLPDDPLDRMDEVILEDQPESNSITRRYLLEMHPSPVRSDASMQPQWQGAAAILGNNAVADAIEARLKSERVTCFRMNADLSFAELQEELSNFWSEEPILHLFITTGFDDDASTRLDSNHWQSRGKQGVRNPFWLCQRWIQKVVDAGKMQDATLVGLSTLGGDFGFSAKSGSIHCAEGGAVAGLLKAIMIESWVNGFRAIPIKMLDFQLQVAPHAVVEAAWHEIANSSFDIETGWKDGLRSVVRAKHAPLANVKKRFSKKSITRGGNWIFTGGGRGITAAVARRIALTYGVKLHLIGKSSLPKIPDSWRGLEGDELKEFKMRIMREARDVGKNSMTAWQDMEKILEVDANLQAFAEEGIEAHYYSCDVSNPDELQQLIDSIRAEHGPIRGCVHGAGVGQDARFDRKRPEKVEQCIAAKYDGSLALMKATSTDPLECFIGFGSISGRFGANGHTDYSLSNDVLAKIMGWYRSIRPEVPSTVFHWHAWGDIGMATKPETKLALEMIDMTFMPAEEGLSHLIREIDEGMGASEVLITDDRYYRLFFPAETLVQEGNSSDSIDQVARFAFFKHDEHSSEPQSEVDRIVLDPTKEVFLREHCLQNRPLLPIVVGLEMLVETAMQRCGAPTWAEGCKGLLVENLEAIRGLRFFDDTPISVELVQRVVDAKVCDVMLQADFRSRSGLVVDRNRHYLRGRIRCDVSAELFSWDAPNEFELQWESAKYPDSQQPFFVGPSFQVLKKVYLGQDRVYGKILAPILVELAGSHRHAEGWQVPSAVLDACLFTTGHLAWNRIAAGISLPVGMKALSIRALPEVGETCMIESRWKRSEGKYAWFDFALWGRGKRILMQAEDYQICWLDGSPS